LKLGGGGVPLLGETCDGSARWDVNNKARAFLPDANRTLVPPSTFNIMQGPQP